MNKPKRRICKTCLNIMIWSTVLFLWGLFLVYSHSPMPSNTGYFCMGLGGFCFGWFFNEFWEAPKKSKEEGATNE